MNPDSSDLRARIDRLEHQNRRLRRGGIAIASAGLLLGLAGMAAPALCDTVFAERLVLRDPSGRQRIVADAYSGTAAISLFSGQGQQRAKIGVADDGEPYLTFFDAKGAVHGTWKGGSTDAAAPETGPKPPLKDPRVSQAR